jgi:gamma-glutamyltranspeptidase/glutathione hydrolase
LPDRPSLPFTTRPELRGTFGMVSSTHWLASAAGMAALEHGGNAFDAAVTAGFVLQVVEPHLNGPGGEVPIILSSALRGEVVVICGQGVAPGAATIERFRELGLDLVPGTGLLPACVPGAFGAWMLLLREFGTLRLAEVLEPAIGYAEHGYPVVPGMGAIVSEVEQLFRDEWTTSAAVYLPSPRPGRLHSNARLAATYRRIVAEAERASTDRDEQIEAARRAFYEGFVAHALVAFLERTEAMDSSGRRHRGLLSGDDLASWRASIEAPVTLDFGRFTVCKTGPWGQGPVFLQQLALLEGLDLEAIGRLTGELVHAVVECAKLAFADREAWYGDPDAVDVPLAELLGAAYAERRRGLVGDSASAELRPGSPDGREPRLPPALADLGAVPVGIGEPTRGDTCHVDVVDRAGNLVSATPSGGWLHGSPVVPELGFPLGTRAQMFWLTEGLAASLAPGRRPRTTLSPSLALRDGKPYLAFGTPGGDQQDQWSLGFFLEHAVFGLDLQAAIDAPTWHTNHFPSSFYPRQSHPLEVEVEARLDPGAVADLRRRGHDVKVTGEWSLGRMCAVAREPAGVLKAAANPRGMQGYAVGR